MMHSFPFLPRWSVFLALLAFTFGGGPGLWAEAEADDGEESEEDKRMTADDLTPEMRASITPTPPNRKIPFEPGLRLTYALGWGWFDVGTGVLTVTEEIHEGKPTLRFTMATRTNGFADTFYKVRTTTSSWTDREMTRTVHYLNEQREGKRERDIVVTFGEGPAAQYHNRTNEENRDAIPIVEGTWDPLAITFYVGTLPLAVGDNLVIPTTNGRELFLTSVNVVERERRRFRMGRQYAYRLDPDIKDLGGVFKKKRDSAVRFWFAAEGDQFPLRMESEVSVGSFWAELVEVERNVKP